MSAALPVIVNASGGTASSLGDALAPKIEAAFANVGLAIDIHLVKGEELLDTVRKYADAPIVAVGGGDGSLGGAAGILAEAGSTMAILPLGTRNHLAKQLGLPEELGDVARLIASGSTARIDIAHVGKRTFVNNASIGTYPQLVRTRDHSNLPKWLATIPAAWFVLRRHDHQQLTLAWQGETRDIVTPMLFIGNNRYELDGEHIGKRTCITDGGLSIYAVARRGRMALIAFAIRALFGRADAQRDFDALVDTPALIVAGNGGSVDVALDGEVERMKLPLEFTIAPRGLSVVAAPGEADGPAD
ncbi:MAG: diacylglycerol kinase family lipid kinase [Sphingomonadales bacterium]|nr:diacylglycerol kinase family lipid kinase [Sphingomonadales bacterium]